MAVAPQTRRWTRDEYHQMAELGWFDGQRVELIEGEIVEMSPQGEPHFQAIDFTADALRAAFGPGHWVRQQGPLALSIGSEPEPDVAVVPGSPRDYRDHPISALLVVEISESSLAYDRTHKASMYAGASIREYWIVKLVDHQLEIYRTPVADPLQPYGFVYADVVILKAADRAAPLAAPQSNVAVRDLWP